MRCEYDVPESCSECRYFFSGDYMWPDECEAEGRSLEGHDNEFERPSWCPMDDEED